MKKNPFTQVLVIAIAAVCIICAVVMINVSNESEKCIKSGCDNYKAYESEYCYTHKPSSKKSKSSETPSYNNKSLLYYKLFEANPKNFPHSSTNFASSTSNGISSDALGISN